MSTQYRPSLLCRIIGHRWVVSLRKNGHFEPDSGDSKWVYDIEHYQQTHCIRCGMPNPQVVTEAQP